MNIEEIRNKISLEEYEISYHAEKERYAEDISIVDIENATMTGEILEQYADDKRGMSCLVLGHSRDRAIHMVVGHSSQGWLRIITVYLPKQPKWSDERTRAGGSNIYA